MVMGLKAAVFALSRGWGGALPSSYDPQLAAELSALWPIRCWCHPDALGVSDFFYLHRAGGEVRLRCGSPGFGRFGACTTNVPPSEHVDLRIFAPDGSAALARSALAAFQLGGSLALPEAFLGLRDARPLVGSMQVMRSIQGHAELFCPCAYGDGRGLLGLLWTSAGIIEPACVFCRTTRFPVGGTRLIYPLSLCPTPPG